MDDLSDVIALCPKDRALLVVLHTPGRSLMDRAVLRLLADRSDTTTPDLGALDGMRLALGRPPRPLDTSTWPDQGVEDTPNGGHLGPLLGVAHDAVGRLDGLRGNLRNGLWSPSDVLPMLVLGSTPDLPMSLTCPRAENKARLVPVLETELLPYARMFAGDPQAALELDGDVELLRRMIEEARSAKAVHLVVQRDPTRRDPIERLRVVGQPGRRGNLLNALTEAFDGVEPRRDYVRILLCCGLLHALNIARAAAEAAPTVRTLGMLLRALRAAGQLDGEITELDARRDLAWHRCDCVMGETDHTETDQ